MRARLPQAGSLLSSRHSKGRTSDVQARSSLSRHSVSLRPSRPSGGSGSWSTTVVPPVPVGHNSTAAPRADKLSACRALLLDVSFRALEVVSWQRAVTLSLFNKAEVLEVHDTVVRSANASHVLKIKLYVKRDERRRLTCTRGNVLLRDAYQCQYCGAQESGNARGLTLDHVVPISRGGAWSWTNLVCCCTTCNGTKGARLLSETKMKLLRVPREPSPSSIFSYKSWSERQDPKLAKLWGPYLAV